eukprot:TRINITY_DN2371_c0_g3_i1.p1 TRINITY_DN2371_c0_g3~~TRINITY_DN2371_c0_g3_i1.p1  ORF type:complete len:842 (+),score=191.73 TRINITY_DN2371_c0_g3_i1:43-2526(+)
MPLFSRIGVSLCFAAWASFLDVAQLFAAGSRIGLEADDFRVHASEEHASVNKSLTHASVNKSLTAAEGIPKLKPVQSMTTVSVPPDDSGDVEDEEADDKDDAALKEEKRQFSEAYRTAKYRNFHKMYDRHHRFWVHLSRSKYFRWSIFVGVAVAFCGAPVLYFVLRLILLFLTDLYRAQKMRSDDPANATSSGVMLSDVIMNILPLVSFYFMGDIAIRCVDFTGHRWVQVDVEQGFQSIQIFVIGWALVRILGVVHHTFEQTVWSHMTDDWLRRRDFMTLMCSPTDVEPATDEDNTQEAVFFEKVWTPFYKLSVGVVWISTILVISGSSYSSYIVQSSYVGLILFGSVFGAHTIGADLYGGFILLLEKPFKVGDIVSLEDKAGAGGCVGTVVTGFVERMSIRSVKFRRFDMRACHVPNSIIAKSMISNWERPRKIILLDFALSHRSPPEAIKKFSVDAMGIVKNHPDIDQQLYTKAVFNKLTSGYMFRVVCFNMPGTKKQFVQQDLIFRFSQLARKLGVVLTFNESSRVFDGPAEEHYFDQTQDLEKVNLETVLPPKREKTKATKTSPLSTILIRLEGCRGLHHFMTSERDQFRFFVKVDIDCEDPDAQSENPNILTRFTPATSVWGGKNHEVKFRHTLQFPFTDEWQQAVPRKARLEVCAVQVYFDVGILSRNMKVLGSATLDLASLASANHETSRVRLDCHCEVFQSLKLKPPKLPKDHTVDIGIRVFKAKNLEFAHPVLKSRANTVAVEPGSDGEDDEDDFDQEDNLVNVKGYLSQGVEERRYSRRVSSMQRSQDLSPPASSAQATGSAAVAGAPPPPQQEQVP